MKDLGKHNVVGVLVNAVDYAVAVRQIIEAAQIGKPFSVTALAVHGIMTGVGDSQHRYRLNHFDLVTPDGQPVRWALNLLYKTGLSDRVYGPKLTLLICQAAAEAGLPVYFYGSRPEVLEGLRIKLGQSIPKLKVAGLEPSKFRVTSEAEQLDIAERIRASGAKITFVGLGCPRQEVFAYEYRDLLSMPVLAVGAAFDYHAGLVNEPPAWMQRSGLQWLYRLLQQPARLWRRYVLLNPAYIGLLLAQVLGLWHPDPNAAQPPSSRVKYG